MNKTVLTPFTILCLLSTVFLMGIKISVKASPSIIHVPMDYPTIQGAVLHANQGDIINVSSGIYHEKVILDKSISLMGECRDNTIIDGSNAGTVVEITTDNVSIADFTIRNAGSSVRDYGIKLSMVENCKVYGNILTNNGWGDVKLIDSLDNFLTENVIINSSRDGIILYNSNNNTVEKNVIKNAGHYGIVLQHAHHSRIIENIVVNSRHDGIAILASNKNLVCRNIVTQGQDNGIRLDGRSDHNMVTENIVTNNKAYGFWMWGSNNNVFYHNLCNNTNNVVILDSYNSWDNGYPSGGNYWSDYSGTDVYSGPFQNETGSDGIGDYPYVIHGRATERNQDNYPLMNYYSVLFDMRVLYYGLLEKYSNLHVDYNTLNTVYYSLLADYNNLNKTHYNLLYNYAILYEGFEILNTTFNEILTSYNNLQTEYDNITATLSEYKESSMSELDNIRNLMYLFIATTIILMATTAYFAIRKLKIIPKTKTKKT